MREAGWPAPENLSDQADPFWRDGLDPGESVAQVELFKGTIGLFKNPSSHCHVDYSDPTEAAETVLSADLFLRMLRASEWGYDGLEIAKVPEGPVAGEGANLHGD
ncbi:TIGR02391 family protein [Micromonospora zamorensis]|uniref:TIGR02391 family protein n=1 Tax=Micromonospora zamorensis TaxID=709883 RepID=UPI0033B5625F